MFDDGDMMFSSVQGFTSHTDEKLFDEARSTSDKHLKSPLKVRPFSVFEELPDRSVTED
jgi:hypothetical protein